MNRDTFAGFVGGTAVGQIASQTLASTTETEFVYNTGVSGATTGIAILKVPLLADVRGFSAAPIDPAANGAQDVRFGNRDVPQRFNANNLDNGVPFLLRLAGLATPASNAGNTLTLKLYLGDSKSGTNIVTTGAVNMASTTTARAFLVETQLKWDSTSQVLRGQFWWDVKGTSATDYVTWAANSAAATSVTAALLHFCASATWGDAVGGVIQVSEFSLSRL